ncbi:MAG TPA: SRPBCC domain-containing protein [Puia sp.]|nr:SRPBCC domain-containing protein [Puia sp.]
MEQKTKVHAEDGKHDMTITREFDLPVELLFKAHADAEILEQWMTSKVVVLESKKNGSYLLEKTDDKGNVVFQARGVIHEFNPNRKIIRTFEMGNTPFGVQLEIYEFEKLTDETSKLRMHVIYESVEQRDQVLQLPFTQGLNWAHNRIEEILSKVK